MIRILLMAFLYVNLDSVSSRDIYSDKRDLLSSFLPIFYGREDEVVQKLSELKIDEDKKDGVNFLTSILEITENTDQIVSMREKLDQFKFTTREIGDDIIDAKNILIDLRFEQEAVMLLLITKERGIDLMPNFYQRVDQLKTFKKLVEFFRYIQLFIGKIEDTTEVILILSQAEGGSREERNYYSIILFLMTKDNLTSSQILQEAELLLKVPSTEGIVIAFLNSLKSSELNDDESARLNFMMREIDRRNQTRNTSRDIELARLNSSSQISSANLTQDEQIRVQERSSLASRTTDFCERSKRYREYEGSQQHLNRLNEIVEEKNKFLSEAERILQRNKSKDVKVEKKQKPEEEKEASAPWMPGPLTPEMD